MRSVLHLAYHFPPVGGGGVQRNLGMVRHLAPLGYRSVVITGTERPKGHWAPEDATLAETLPPDTEVHRLPGPQPPDSGVWRARLERRLLLRPAFTRWWLEGALAAGRAHGGDADVVYASLIPYDTAEAAARLARELRKPLVVDLQDPWALDEMWMYPTGLHRRVDLRRMRAALEAADAIVMNTPEAARRVRSHFPQLGDKPIVSIPNGFDPADFAGSSEPHDDGTFRIVHTGYLHTADGLRLRKVQRLRRVLGGTFTDVDILTRSHVYLLQAIDRLLAEDPSLASTLELHLAGVLTPADREAAAGSPVVRMPGYLGHSESVALVRSADLLFLPMQDLPPGVRAGLVPGKTYEYLASRRPILAAVPEGDARDLLKEGGSAFIVSPADVGAMAGILAEQLERWRRGQPAPEPRPEVVARYERPAQARLLAELFSRILGD